MITLKATRLQDFSTIIKWVTSQESLMQWAGPAFQFPLDDEQWKDYISRPHQFTYTAVETTSNIICGHIALGNIDSINQQARIGKVIVNPDSRGKGIAEHMIKQVLTIAFNEYRCHKVTLGVFDFNTPALHCYEKLGFQKDGLLRDHRKLAMNIGIR